VESTETENHWHGFEVREFDCGGLRIHTRVDSGRCDPRPVLVLLHGFPQSHVMWRRVAQRLRERFFIVMPDLRGYGDSAVPADEPEHAQASKRAMADDVVALMDKLGVPRFYLCGHDRGARVAHRLAIDHAERVERLCLIDIAPTLDMYERTDMAFARAYYHWFHLIQPAPLPEMMIGPVAREYLHAKLGGWGSAGLDHLEPAALADYERCFCRPEAIHAACEDYRASAGIDLEHDRASRARGERIACQTLLLWGEHGVINRLFDPMELWQAQCAARVSGQCLPAGHFIPEELPDATALALERFMRREGR
jgi:haloacetate dehalogenase